MGSIYETTTERTTDNKIIDQVLSRDELMASYVMSDPECALIGAWSPGDWVGSEIAVPEYILEYKKMQSYFSESIKLDFWDTENNVPGYPSINSTQAYVLAQFIERNKDKQFCIHCDAGQSRSAGIALAVECIIRYNGDKYAFMTDSITPYVNRYPRYSPNYFVYDKIVEMWREFKKPGGWVKPAQSEHKTIAQEEQSPIGSNPYMEEI